MERTIKLSETETQIPRLFSRIASASHQRIEFEEHDTQPRECTEIQQDILVGKLAEVAVAKLIRQDHGIHIPVNYEIYDRGEWDDEDIILNGWSIDVKATKKGRWLLFERNKAVMRKRSNTMPDAIVICRVDDEQTVRIIGGISTKQLLNDEKTVQRLRKGECIPGTETRLQADNYAVSYSDLMGADELFSFMAKRRKTQ